MLSSRLGNNEKLRQLFLARAEANTDKDVFLAGKSAIEAARQRVASLSQNLTIAERRMATEEDSDRYQSIAKQFDAITLELKTAQRILEDREKLHQPQEQRSPDEEVELALQLVEEFKRAANDQSARGGISPLLDRFGIRLGLNFGQDIKGKKREIRQLLGGLMTFGGAPLPVPIHGRDNRDDENFGQEAPNCQTTTKLADNLCNRDAGLAPIPGDGSQVPAVSENECQHEGISFTKGSRDDRI